MNSTISAKSTVSNDSVCASTLQGMFYPEDAIGLTSLLTSYYVDSSAYALLPVGISVSHICPGFAELRSLIGGYGCIAAMEVH